MTTETKSREVRVMISGVNHSFTYGEGRLRINGKEPTALPWNAISIVGDNVREAYESLPDTNPTKICYGASTVISQDGDMLEMYIIDIIMDRLVLGEPLAAQYIIHDGKLLYNDHVILLPYTAEMFEHFNPNIALWTEPGEVNVYQLV